MRIISMLLLRSVFFMPPVMFITSIAFTLVVFTSAYAGKEDEFREYLNQAKSLKDSVVRSTSGFAPEAAFSNYSAHPEPARYYSEDDAGASQTIRSDSITAVTANTEGQAITESSKVRTQFKINPESEEIKKSKESQRTAGDATKGVSDEFIGRREKQVDTVQTRYVVRTCNEEIRPLKRICDKTPIVTASIRSNLYPGCQRLVLVEGTLEDNGLCPYGYVTSDYMYMIRFSGPNVRFCTKLITIDEGTECFGGFFGAGIMHADYRVSGTGSSTVPKKRHSRIKISHAYNGSIAGTIINATTGATLYNEATFSNGQVIELPFSEELDQTFRFYAVQKSGRRCFVSCRRPLGIMTLHIDHEYKENKAEVSSWQEVCHNV